MPQQNGETSIGEMNSSRMQTKTWQTTMEESQHRMHRCTWRLTANATSSA